MTPEQPAASVTIRAEHPEQWRRLPFVQGATAPLLAGVEGLVAGFGRFGQPTIRWYVMEHPSLILGSSQRLSEVDFAACASEGVTVHRRRSGGTAVYTDATLLSLDVALPAGHRLLPANITEAYRWFGEAWQMTLARVGINSYVLPDAEARALNPTLAPAVRQVCFGGVSPYEVLLDGRKLVGLAQIRRRPGGLLQAGIYTHWRPRHIAHLLAGTPDERRERAELLARRAVGLAEAGAAHTDFARIIRTWEQTLLEITGVTLVDSDWTAEEQAVIEDATPRYAALPMPANTV